MVSKTTSIVINNNNNGKNEGRAISLSTDKVVKIKVEPGKKYILNSDGDVGPENVTVSRNGDDLIVMLEGDSEPALVLEGYFAQPESPGLYGVAEDGQLYAYTRTDGVPGILELVDGASEPIALGQEPLGLGAPFLVAGGEPCGLWPLLAAGAAAGLVGLGVHQFNRDDSHDGGPVGPTIGGINDDVGPKQGPLADGEITDDSTPTVYGRGEPGSTLAIFDNGDKIGETQVNGNGDWTFTPESPLPDGSHTFTAGTVCAPRPNSATPLSSARWNTPNSSRKPTRCAASSSSSGTTWAGAPC
ncbi:MAG TPA: Ig-like domain-containing protein [Variovorax sp.]|nr:Ig-like domain-containing protein [Variovorax sp.]